MKTYDSVLRTPLQGPARKSQSEPGKAGLRAQALTGPRCLGVQLENRSARSILLRCLLHQSVSPFSPTRATARDLRKGRCAGVLTLSFAALRLRLPLAPFLRSLVRRRP